jgi:6-phosphogluconolactonase
MTVPLLLPQFSVLPDARAVAETAAEQILRTAAQAIARDGEFRLVLAGGSTPLTTYRLLAGAGADWERWAIWFGDERCLPADHPQRNSRQAWEAWLGSAPIPPAQVHVIPAELGPEAGALAYSEAVAAGRPFHLVLLGMGEDGHTASLFPKHGELPGVEAVPVRNAPKPPADRVSLSTAALSDTQALLILVTGAGKQAAWASWRRGGNLPVARIGSRGSRVVLLDRAAAG